MKRAAEFERWLQRAIRDQVGVGCAVQTARNRGASHQRAEQLAEELLQEAYTRAWQHQDKINDEEHLRNRLCRIVINLTIEYFRRPGNRQCSLSEDQEVAAPRPCQLDDDDRESLAQHLARLAPDDRELIELRYFKGYTLAEIRAQRPGLGSVPTIWRRLHQVQQALRAAMSQE